MRYSVGRGGPNEPGLLLIIDHNTGIVVARSSDIAFNEVHRLVQLANKGAIADAESNAAKSRTTARPDPDLQV